VGIGDALCCLAAAPCMADLHSWSSWQQVSSAAPLCVQNVSGLACSMHG
jgi:hypothetical protein